MARLGRRFPNLQRARPAILPPLPAVHFLPPSGVTLRQPISTGVTIADSTRALTMAASARAVTISDSTRALTLASTGQRAVTVTDSTRGLVLV